MITMVIAVIGIIRTYHILLVTFSKSHEFLIPIRPILLLILLSRHGYGLFYLSPNNGHHFVWLPLTVVSWFLAHALKSEHAQLLEYRCTEVNSNILVNKHFQLFLKMQFFFCRRIWAKNHNYTVNRGNWCSALNITLPGNKPRNPSTSSIF